MNSSAIATRLRAAGCVFAEEEARLLIAAARDPSELDAMVERRAAGLPLEQVIGWAEFCGLRILVEPGVFVPRSRTEFLMEQAAALASPGAVVVDMCCGSGAVGAALAAAVPGVELHAADIDPVAVRCARRNLAALGGHVHQGDLYAALPAGLRGGVDVLVVNGPYVPTQEIELLPREAREHEPRLSSGWGRRRARRLPAGGRHRRALAASGRAPAAGGERRAGGGGRRDRGGRRAGCAGGEL